MFSEKAGWGWGPTWQRLLAALTQTSKILPTSSSVRVGFSPVVPQGTMPAVLSGGTSYKKMSTLAALLEIEQLWALFCDQFSCCGLVFPTGCVCGAPRGSGAHTQHCRGRTEGMCRPKLWADVRVRNGRCWSCTKTVRCAADCFPRAALVLGSFPSPLLAVPVDELADLVVVHLVGVGEGGHEGHVGPGHSELRHLAEKGARRQHSRMPCLHARIALHCMCMHTHAMQGSQDLQILIYGTRPGSGEGAIEQAEG